MRTILNRSLAREVSSEKVYQASHKLQRNAQDRCRSSANGLSKSGTLDLCNKLITAQEPMKLRWYTGTVHSFITVPVTFRRIGYCKMRDSPLGPGGPRTRAGVASLTPSPRPPGGTRPDPTQDPLMPSERTERPPQASWWACGGRGVGASPASLLGGEVLFDGDTLGATGGGAFRAP